MTIPQVDRDVLLRALEEFDRTLREGAEFQHWEILQSQHWAIEHEGKLYPPKKILSLATGAPVSSFSGGPESNAYLSQRGFVVRRLHDESLREAFTEILERYPTVRKTQTFGGNTEARELFNAARGALRRRVDPDRYPHLQVVASYGKGNWAHIPWISILDRRETKTTQDGTYVVFLFHDEGKGVYLKLAQGVTLVEREHGARAVGILQEQASKLRTRCGALAEQGWDLSGQSDLGATGRLAKLYEASTVAAKFYASDSIPSDGEIEADFEAILDVYEKFVDEKVQQRGEADDQRPLSLVGTWRSIDQDLPRVREAIDLNGGWASWWSFPVKEEAQRRLEPPFFLYAYQGDGKLAARLRVDEYVTSRGQAGIPSPWPDMTDEDCRFSSKLSEKQSEVFKTWFRIGAVERLSPPKGIDDFEIAIGLSTPESVFNQNTFGYVIEDEDVNSETALHEPEAPAVQQREELQSLVDRTGLDRALIQELVEALLGSSPQIILAGPPGTSKTWLARQLALHVAAQRPEQTHFVQFHPGYTYESFIEGLRPVTRGGGVQFELTPGLVVKTVNEMRHRGVADHAGVDYVIVMDELNRANLPRVLGELMFAFEYRDQSVRLQYSGDFALPTNLRFIGTMNTADRSIRSIDVALRRRFEVFELGPDAGVLSRFLVRAGTPMAAEIVTGFEALNAQLCDTLDRHHTIGHAFFMRPGLDGQSMRRIWARRLYPLIEEFLFDQPDALSQYSFERFWPGL